VSVGKQDFIVFDLGSQIPKGAAFVVLASRQARLLSYGEEGLDIAEELFYPPGQTYSNSLQRMLRQLTKKENFSLILCLPLHHLIWQRRKTVYRRKPSLEPLSSQELKNLFFYVQSRLLERNRRERPDLFFVAGALSELKLDGQERELLGARGRELEFTIINSFAPHYLIDFTKTAFPFLASERISFFVFPLGIRGKQDKPLLIVDSGAAKISLTELSADLVRNVEILPLGGIDFTYALARKGENLASAEQRKVEGSWSTSEDLSALIEISLGTVKDYDEKTQALLCGRSWPGYLEEEIRRKVAGEIFWEKELNEELALFPELPLPISAAMRFSLFSEEDTPQRLFQRVAATVVR